MESGVGIFYQRKQTAVPLRQECVWWARQVARALQRRIRVKAGRGGEETGGQAAAEGIQLSVASQTTGRSWLSLWVEGFEQSVFIDSRLKIDNRRTQGEIWKQVRSHCNNSHQKRRSMYWDDNAEWLVWGHILKVESTGSDVRWIWSVSQRKRKRMILKFWASKMGKTILFFEI